MVVDGLEYRDHISHFSVSQGIACALDLGAAHTVLIGMNHHVEYYAESARMQAWLSEVNAARASNASAGSDASTTTPADTPSSALLNPACLDLTPVIDPSMPGCRQASKPVSIEFGYDGWATMGAFSTVIAISEATEAVAAICKQMRAAVCKPASVGTGASGEAATGGAGAGTIESSAGCCGSGATPAATTCCVPSPVDFVDADPAAAEGWTEPQPLVYLEEFALSLPKASEYLKAFRQVRRHIPAVGYRHEGAELKVWKHASGASGSM